MFRENEFSIFGKASIYILLVLIALASTSNIFHGIVPNPYLSAITLVGFLMFFVAKASVISKGIKFSFGTRNMTNLMANLYRLGYWLMFVGIVLTFLD